MDITDWLLPHSEDAWHAPDMTLTAMMSPSLGTRRGGSRPCSLHKTHVQKVGDLQVCSDIVWGWQMKEEEVEETRQVDKSQAWDLSFLVCPLCLAAQLIFRTWVPSQISTSNTKSFKCLTTPFSRGLYHSSFSLPSFWSHFLCPHVLLLTLLSFHSL